MDQSDDDRYRRNPALRATGVGLGLLGATFGGVAGWFTLAAAEPATAVASAAPVAAIAFAEPATGQAAAGGGATAETLGVGTGKPHTRTWAS